MTLTEQIMKLQTYKMFEGEDTVYVERDDVIKALEQEPCEDAVDRELVRKEFCNWIMSKKTPNDFLYILGGLPSVTPKFTDTEIQKMQELEQAQLEKAYELGRAEVQPCDDTISKKDVMAIIEWAYDECKIDGYTDYCEIRDMVKELPSVTPKKSKD